MKLVNWKKKWIGLQRVFNADSYLRLVEVVFKDTEHEDSEDATKLVATMHKWHDSVRPRSALVIPFFSRMAQLLQCPEDVTAAMLMESTYEQFLTLLPDYTRVDFVGVDAIDGLPQHDNVVGGGYPNSAGDEAAHTIPEDLYTVEFFESGPDRYPSIRQTPAKMFLDQRLFYQHPDCAKYWEGVINDRKYPTFDKCKFSLDKLYDEKIYKKEIKEKMPDSVVMLGGGGAFCKDVALISNLLDGGQYTSEAPLHYCLLDISTWMLRRSRYRLAVNWPETNWSDRVELRLIAGDFMNLNKEVYRKRLRRDSGRMLWVLSGGTIGNISEASFLRSLGHVVSPGDLFILSASVQHPPGGLDVSDDGGSRYLSAAVKRLLKSTIQDLITDRNMALSVDTVLNKFVARSIPDVVPGVTDVPDSHSLVVTAEMDGKEFNIFSHTYYSEESLKAYVEEAGWTHLATAFPDYHVPDFAQFLFKKNS